MKRYWALYKKELKSIFGVGMLIASITMIVSVFYILNFVVVQLSGGIHKHIVWQDSIRSYYAIYDSWMPLVFFSRLFIKNTLYMIPVILTFSFIIERTTKTDYLLQTMPVFKSAHILLKFLAAITMGTLFSLIIAMNDSMIWMSMVAAIRRKMEMNMDNFFLQSFSSIKVRSMVMLKFTLRYLGYIFLLCCFVCCAQGVILRLNRYKIPVWMSVFFGSIIPLAYLFPDRPHSHYPIRMSWITLLIGLFTLCIGLYLYEKHSEI